MPPQRGHHDICILKVGDQYRVRPAVWTSDAQPKSNKPPWVTFRNLTNETVFLVFPSPVLYVQGSSGVAPAIPSQGSTVTLVPQRGAKNSTQADVASVDLVVKDVGEVPGSYQYSVFAITPTGAVQAVGESEPIIIIDPPA